MYDSRASHAAPETKNKTQHRQHGGNHPSNNCGISTLLIQHSATDPASNKTATEGGNHHQHANVQGDSDE
jgi:hypothetical protein